MIHLRTLSRGLMGKFRSLWLFRIGAVLRRRWARQLPQNSDGKVLIHIGPGEFDDPRYINVDARRAWHVHVVGTLEEFGQKFPQDYADLIYGCHILEHIAYANVPKVLAQLYDCLKPGGILRLSVPNFSVIVDMYEGEHRVEDILPPLMGGQGYPANFHYTAFDEAFLRSLLIKAGFRDVHIWDPASAQYYTFNDWAGRQYPLYGKQWPISLNLEGVK